MTTSTTPAPKDVLAALWATAGGDPAALGAVTMTGADPVLPSVFRVGTAAAASVAASALAAAELWHLRRGGRQSVSVDMRRAAIAFRSERYLSVDGAPPPEIWSPVSGHFQAGDGRWVQLHCNFPHHRDGVLEVLGVGEDRAAVAAAIARRGAEELERETRARGLCVAFVRTPEEWRAHPHALQLATLPLLEIIRIGDAPPEPLAAAGGRPRSPMPLAPGARGGSARGGARTPPPRRNSPRSSSRWHGRSPGTPPSRSAARSGSWPCACSSATSPPGRRRRRRS